MGCFGGEKKKFVPVEQKEFVDPRVEVFFQRHPAIECLQKKFKDHMVRYEHLPMINRQILKEDFDVTDEDIVSLYLQMTENLPPVALHSEIKKELSAKAKETVRIDPLTLSRQRSLQGKTAGKLRKFLKEAFNGVNDPEVIKQIEEERERKRAEARAKKAQGQTTGPAVPARQQPYVAA